MKPLTTAACVLLLCGCSDKASEKPKSPFTPPAKTGKSDESGKKDDAPAPAAVKSEALKYPAAADVLNGFAGKTVDKLSTTENGLQYFDLKEGDGAPSRAGQVVWVHYTGKLTNGTQFDSSRGKEPISFPLGRGRVIPGWDQGVEGLKPGGKRILVIPPDLAYGAPGRPPVIPQNATLVFEVELVNAR